jgi:hypothetical protein
MKTYFEENEALGLVLRRSCKARLAMPAASLEHLEGIYERGPEHTHRSEQHYGRAMGRVLRSKLAERHVRSRYSGILLSETRRPPVAPNKRVRIARTR